MSSVVYADDVGKYWLVNERVSRKNDEFQDCQDETSTHRTNVSCECEWKKLTEISLSHSLLLAQCAKDLLEVLFDRMFFLFYENVIWRFVIMSLH